MYRTLSEESQILARIDQLILLTRIDRFLYHSEQMLEFYLLVVSFVLTLWSMASAIGIQLLLNKLSFPTIREVMNRRIHPEPTASSFMIFLNYSIIMIVIYLLLKYGEIDWSISYMDLIRVPIAVLIIDISNYIFHRSFHNGFLYRNFHSVHHLNHNPSSWEDSILTDILDWIISSIIYLCPTAILGVTPMTLLVVTWVAIQIQLNHSGYLLPKIPLIISPLEHWAHHQYYSCNYCELTVIPDWIFGTYKSQAEILKKRLSEETS